MKKNENIFGMAEEMLVKKSDEINGERIDYRALYEKTMEDIAKLQKESDEAYLLGNIIRGDELTKEKNILKERAESLNKINLTEVRKNLAIKYSQDSNDFYKLVTGILKQADAEDLKEAQELLEKLFEITSRADSRRSKAISLIGQWKNKVAPYEKGEAEIIFTKLCDLKVELERSMKAKEIANGSIGNPIRF
ncbi:MAG: hypothetical protein K5988_03225 [Lachnospiraceae bacterium]|nr:hypothetical protein [Lachnospiraceae bacterium]